MIKQRGFTFIELFVYIFLMMLAGTALFQLYKLGTNAQNSTISSYIVGGDTETCIRWLRRDFQETALVSIRSYPSIYSASEGPGCSFASPRTLREVDSAKLSVSKYGAPLWTKNVFYTLQPYSGGTLGELVRWEKELTDAEKDFVPRPSSLMPSSLGTKSRQVLLKQIVLPNTKIEHLSGADGYKTDQFGGFRVQFVQRTGGEGGAEKMSSINPGDSDKVGDTADNTSLVEVELKILTSNNINTPSFYVIKLRVHPRY